MVSYLDGGFDLSEDSTGPKLTERQYFVSFFRLIAGHLRELRIGFRINYEQDWSTLREPESRLKLQNY